MRKFLLTVAVIFVIAFSVFAQAGSGWKTFSPANEEFSVEAPESLALNRLAPNGTNHLRLYKTVSDGTYFFITSDKNDNSYSTRFPASFTGEIKAEAVQTTIGNFEGRKFSFADADGFYQEILIVSGKARVYVFHTVSETKDNAAVKRFFSSLLRLDKTMPEANKPVIEEDSKTDSPQNQNTQKMEISSGSGNGVGSGFGNGVGSGTNQTSPAPTNQTSPLKILSKPRPSYTDLARFYEITGEVPLRVTFLASGEIGSIAVVKKLPFGLTTSAINAARNIRFEPARKDGTAYSLTKIVMYNFSLY